MNIEQYLKNSFINDEDIINVRQLGQQLIPVLPEIINTFYEHLRTTADYSIFFTNDHILAHVKKQQLHFWEQFFRADINEEYIKFRILIGNTHARIGLKLDVYYQAVSSFNNVFSKHIIRLGLDNFTNWHSFHKLVSLDTAIVVDTYNEIINKTIEEQTATLMQVSAPVARLWGGILFLPLIGIIDSQRAQNIMSTALDNISSHQAQVFILDIGGVGIVDTAVANHLIKITKASRLMGCLCIISGISPAVAQTIVELGIHTDEISTTANMQDALMMAFKVTGITLQRQNHD